MKLFRLTMAAMMIASAMFSGCAGKDSGDGGTSPTPTGGMNETKPMVRDLTVTAYTTPTPGATKLYRFTPDTLSSKVNETVNIIFRVAANQQGNHNLVIPELGVSLTGVAPGAMKNVTITVAKDGSFKYYCNLNAGTAAQTSHQTLGMDGTITVAKA